MKLYGTSSLQFTTESIGSIAGYGGLFISGSSIYMQNDQDEIYDLTDSKGLMQIVAYTSSGVYNYSRPGNVAYMQIVCIGAGGGGGAGARNTAGTQRGGGAGGSGGVVAQRWFPSGSLPSGIYTVTVGASGSAGVTGSTAGTSAAGGNGGVGGTTSFVSASTTYVSANGGSAGSGCSTAGVAPSGRDVTTATVTGSIPPGGQNTTGMYRLAGVGGGVGGVFPILNKTPNSSGSTPSVILSAAYPIYAFAGGRHGVTPAGTVASFPGGDNWRGGYYGIGGGGAGGHISSSNTSENGGTGSAAFIWGNFVATGSAGTTGANGDNGAPRIANANFLISISSSYFPTASVGPGSPGHGGGPGNTAGTVNGGRGGNGGLFGAGAGGGGGATDPAQAGNGGTGANGCVIIFEYY